MNKIKEEKEEKGNGKRKGKGKIEAFMKVRCILHNR